MSFVNTRGHSEIFAFTVSPPGNCWEMCPETSPLCVFLSHISSDKQHPCLISPREEDTQSSISPFTADFSAAVGRGYLGHRKTPSPEPKSDGLSLLNSTSSSVSSTLKPTQTSRANECLSPPPQRRWTWARTILNRIPTPAGLQCAALEPSPSSQDCRFVANRSPLLWLNSIIAM